MDCCVVDSFFFFLSTEGFPNYSCPPAWAGGRIVDDAKASNGAVAITSEQIGLLCHPLLTLPVLWEERITKDVWLDLSSWEIIEAQTALAHCATGKILKYDHVFFGTTTQG